MGGHRKQSSARLCGQRIPTSSLLLGCPPVISQASWLPWANWRYPWPEGRGQGVWHWHMLPVNAPPVQGYLRWRQRNGARASVQFLGRQLATAMQQVCGLLRCSWIGETEKAWSRATAREAWLQWLGFMSADMQAGRYVGRCPLAAAWMSGELGCTCTYHGSRRRHNEAPRCLSWQLSPRTHARNNTTSNDEARRCGFFYLVSCLVVSFLCSGCHANCARSQAAIDTTSHTRASLLSAVCPIKFPLTACFVLSQLWRGVDLI